MTSTILSTTLATNLSDDEYADQLGKLLAKTYKIKKSRKTGRYPTDHGDKTDRGLARLIVRDILEFKKKVGI